MILSLIASLVAFAPVHGDLVCPVMGTTIKHEISKPGDPAHKPTEFSDYNGVRYWYCCGDCKAKFEKEPAKYVALRAKGEAAGAFLFDPVTGDRLPHDKSIHEYSDYKGVRFLFASLENKAKFDADPKRYGTLPEQEALYCSVGKEAVPGYGNSSGYVDHKGVRYYMCCGGCEKPFMKEPDKNAELSKDYVKTPGIATEKPPVKKGDGK